MEWISHQKEEIKVSRRVKKFDEFCIEWKQKTQWEVIFNRGNQEEKESIDQYMTELQKITRTRL